MIIWETGDYYIRLWSKVDEIGEEESCAEKEEDIAAFLNRYNYHDAVALIHSVLHVRLGVYNDFAKPREETRKLLADLQRLVADCSEICREIQGQSGDENDEALGSAKSDSADGSSE